MGAEDYRTLYLRFAALSLAVVTAGGAAIGYAAVRIDRSSQQHAAAQSAANTVGSPLAQSFEPLLSGVDPPQEVITRAAATAQALLSPSLAGVRVWSEQGASVFSTGVGLQQGARSSSHDLAWRRGTTAQGQKLFVTFAPAGSYTIEIDQTAAALDSSISNSRGRILISTAAFGLVAYGLLQAAFWICIAGLIARHRRLLYLYTAGDEIRASLDLHEVVTQLARDGARLAGGDYAVVALFDEGASELVLHATFDKAANNVSHHERAIDEWFMRRCVATNTTVVTVQASAGYRQFLGEDGPSEGQLHLVCVPLSVRARVVGVLSVLRAATTKGGAFSATEVTQVQQLTGQAVTAIEQAQLFAKVRGHASEIELGYDATLKALMAALEAKDEATEGHGERMARLTVQLAKHLNVEEEHLVDIERGALLHDVGTIGVPDAILKKPDSLNDGEWEAMRKHPLLASLMVSKIGFLEDSMPILLYHHERYDGRGYPFGLTADKIPLEARIFSVVDAYDAMTSDRPYRAAMAHESAMAELLENAGTQFDPDVIAAFNELLSMRPELRIQPGRSVLQRSSEEARPADNAA